MNSESTVLHSLMNSLSITHGLMERALEIYQEERPQSPGVEKLERAFKSLERSINTIKERQLQISTGKH